MLVQIHIRDFATIEEIDLNLNTGCTMITGETGAGKSIFIEAIEIALGARGSAHVVRPGKERADISLCFNLASLPAASAWLKAHDLYQDQNDCIIRRVITRDGRSRIYINGLPSTLQLARDLGELVFHLHGQYEQQVLLKSDNQRDMLDRYAGHIPLAEEVKNKAEEWKAIDHEIKQRQNESQEQAHLIEYLQFQLTELSALALQPGEWESLEQNHHKLTHTEELLHQVKRAHEYLSENEGQNALQFLNEARKCLESIQSVDSKAHDWLNLLHSAIIQLDDLAAELHQYLETTELDPAHLARIEQRIGELFDLARKYKVKPQELADLQTQVTAQLNNHTDSDTVLAALKEKQQKLAADYHHLAKKLSHQRAQAAPQLSQYITDTIRTLSLPHSEFQIELLKEKEDGNISPNGQEKIIFLIKTNPGQSLQPLAKVISGGELSRLSLAAHLALNHQAAAPTFIFDEVDTGVSGAVAEKIGKLLRQLGQVSQVFCVTHQAQVAAYGHHHLLVEKLTDHHQAHTHLRPLNETEKTHEIARMLGGEKMTEKTLEHAREMVLHLAKQGA